MRLAACLLIAALLGAPALAGDRDDPTAGLAAADARLAAAESPLARRNALGAAIRAYEAAIERLRADLARVSGEERGVAREFDVEAAELRRVAAALARIGLAAEPLLLLDAAAPEDVVRASLLVERAAETLKTRAAALARDRAALAALQTEQAHMLSALEDGRGRLNAMRAELIDTFANGAGAGTQSEAPDIGADAQELAALSIALEAVLPPPTAEGLPELDLSPPVAGTLARDFGTEDAAGLPRPGIAVTAQAGALVVSPAAATVRYVGWLDSYGSVVILEPAAEVLIVLAGIDTIVARPGETLAASDPLGFLADPGEVHEEFSGKSAYGSGNAPMKALYIEVRHAGRPMDPLQWFEIYR